MLLIIYFRGSFPNIVLMCGPVSIIIQWVVVMRSPSLRCISEHHSLWSGQVGVDESIRSRDFVSITAIAEEDIAPHEAQFAEPAWSTRYQATVLGPLDRKIVGTFRDRCCTGLRLMFFLDRPWRRRIYQLLKQVNQDCMECRYMGSLLSLGELFLLEFTSVKWIKQGRRDDAATKMLDRRDALVLCLWIGRNMKEWIDFV